MLYRLLIDGTPYTSLWRGEDDFEIELGRKIGISFGIEDVFREKFNGLEIELASEGYCMLCDMKRNNQCHKFLLRIEMRENEGCDYVLFFEGYIYLSNVAFNHHKKIASITFVRDSSYSGLLLQYASKEISLATVKTLSCEDLTPINTNTTFFFDPNDTSPSGYLGTRPTFGLLSVFDFIVKHITNNQMYVVSNYLLATGVDIALGGALNGLTAIDMVYPKISLSKLFNEVRKKYRIAAAVEIDGLGVAYLRIEEEDYLFDNTQILAIPEIPYDLVESINQDSIYSSIKIGSSNTDLSDSGIEAHPQKDFTAWNEEEYLNCSNCVDNSAEGKTLDLVSEFIIDGNVIGDIVMNGGHEKDICFVHTTAQFATKTVDPTSNKAYYNEALRNDNVIQRWYDGLPGCFAVSRYSQYGFRAVNDNTPFVAPADFVDVYHNQLGQVAFSYTTWIDYEIKEYDTSNLLTQNITESTYHPTTPIGTIPYAILQNGQFSSYTIPVNGNYAFRGATDIVFKNTSPHILPTGSILHELIICAYSDNTFSTLLFSHSSGVQIQSSGIIPITLDTNTPLWSLSANNVIVVSLKSDFLMPGGGAGTQIQYRFSNGAFELIEDDSICLNVNEAPNITKINKYEFNYKLCYNDYVSILNNKTGYLLINGKKCWISNIKYNPTKFSTIELISDKSMC